MLRKSPRIEPLRRAAVGLSLSVSLLLSAGVSFAEPSAEEKAAARALATQGTEALKMNRYGEALDLVTRAESIFHAPTHLLLIARAQVGSGKLVAAQETYLKLIHEELRADAPAVFKSAQASAREELPAIEPRIASLRIVVEGAAQKSATVKLDEATVPSALLNVYRPVDPGPHVITVSSAGQSPVQGSVELRDGERRDFKLTIPDGPQAAGAPLNATNPDAGKLGTSAGTQPPDSGSGGFFTPLRGAGIGLGVAGVAGLVLGAAFLVTGTSQQSLADGKAQGLGCTGAGFTQCPPSQAGAVNAEVTPLDQTAALDKNVAGAAFAVGGAALVAGVVMIVVGKPQPRVAAAGPSRVSVAPWFGGTSGGVLGEF